MNTIIYKSHFELMNSLTDAQAGALIKAIGQYCSGVMPDITNPLIKGIFLGLRHDFDTQAENYEKKVNANRENGKKGGRPKKPNLTEDNPINPMGFLETQSNPINPQNLKDKDKDKDKDIEKDINKDNSSISTDTESAYTVKREFVTLDNKIDFDRIYSVFKNESNGTN